MRAGFFSRLAVDHHDVARFDHPDVRRPDRSARRCVPDACRRDQLDVLANGRFPRLDACRQRRRLSLVGGVSSLHRYGPELTHDNLSRAGPTEHSSRTCRSSRSSKRTASRTSRCRQSRASRRMHVRALLHVAPRQADPAEYPQPFRPYLPRADGKRSNLTRHRTSSPIHS